MFIILVFIFFDINLRLHIIIMGLHTTNDICVYTIYKYLWFSDIDLNRQSHIAD